MSVDGGLRKLFKDEMKVGWHWQSIESALMGGGIPDLNGMPRGGVETWIELKQTKEWAVTLRVDQVGWIFQRVRYGGRVFVAVRRNCTAGPKRKAADELWLLRGSFVREAKRGGLRGLPPAAVLGVWAGGPSNWNWAEVDSHLRTSPP